MLCLGSGVPADGGETEKVDVAAAVPVETHDSSSSDGDADGQDEAQYRITVPLDVRLAAPAPVFAAATQPGITSTHAVLPATPACQPRPLPAVPSAGAVRPLLSVDLTSLPPAHIVTRPPHLCHPPPQQQQLMLPASTPAPLVIQPRCRDYDGECMSTVVKRRWYAVDIHYILGLCRSR